ncbi:Peroxisomal acyl-coenzyme A oxidase 1 [Mactra antiquata]
MAVNPDLQKERNSATFDSQKLTEFLYNGKDRVDRRRFVQNLVFQDEYLNSFKPWWNREREESYDTCVKRSIYLQQFMDKHGITKPEERAYVHQAAANEENDVIGLHKSMFIPTISRLGTKEQVEKYGVPAKQNKILGTYAQTELGHGTFIRGLETTATFDPSTQEFIINSPNVTSIKYWPGGGGKTCNYVILMAKLYTQGQSHGIHAFVVQTRSLKDHTPMPGVSVGDIGNKLGFSDMDNSFIKFDNYRVPKDAMLMRHAKVEVDGTYIPAKNSKITYGSMMNLRALIVGSCAVSLAQAATIATRYSAVRRQTEVRPGGEEAQVLDYQTQQEKLFPMIASAYAFMFVGRNILREFNRIMADMERGMLDEMQVLHALAAGMKAYCSDVTSYGVDKLRMACGGHGYTHASGIPKIWASATPACTYEGENTIMYLQCARYLVKQYGEAVKGKKLAGFMSYLNNPVQQRSSLDENFTFEHLVQAYEHAASRLIKAASLRIQSLMRIGSSSEEARNNSSVIMVKAAKAHCQVYIVKVFMEETLKSNMDTSVSKAMKTLCQLYATCGIYENLGNFIQDGFLSSKQADMVSNKMLSLFSEMRPNAVAFVDAFDYHDQVLQSCIGRYDGQVYQALYEYAKGSPLNKSDVHESYYTTLRPLMKGEYNITPAKL